MALPFRILGLALVAAAVASCTSVPQDGEEKTPSTAATAPSEAAAPAPPADESPSGPPEISPAPRAEIPDAIVVLQEKLLPSVDENRAVEPAEPTPPQAPDPEETRAAAEKTLASFLEAVAQGETEKARGFLISRGEFDRYVTAGFIPILEGILAKNEALVVKLEEALQGRKVAQRWEPASVALTPERGVFVRPLPVTSGRLHVEADGVELVVKVDQLVEVDGAWRIFQISAP